MNAPINLGWSDFKAFFTSRSLSPQFIMMSGNYYLLAYDGPMSVSCYIATDGSQTADQGDFETNYKAKANGKLVQKNADGIPVHEMALRRGVQNFINFTIVSHDFSDRTSWYQKSVQITGETLTNPSGDGLTYQSVNANWVNINSPKLTYDYGKILERDGTLSVAAKRYVAVSVNGNALIENTDFTVNYTSGQVVFNTAPASAPIVSYWHNNVSNASEFVFLPPANMQYRIEHVEAQFSINSVFNDAIQLEIWAGAVANGGVNIGAYGNFSAPYYNAGYGQSRSIYRNMNDFLNWCNNSYPPVPACGDLKNDVLIMPFLYLIHPVIDSWQGSLIRVFLPNDKPIGAEISTVTLYMEKGPSGVAS